MRRMWNRIFVAAALVGAVSFGGLGVPVDAQQTQDQKPPDPKKKPPVEKKPQKPEPRRPAQPPAQPQKPPPAPPRAEPPPQRPPQSARPQQTAPPPRQQAQPQRPVPQQQAQPRPEPRHLGAQQQQVLIGQQQQRLAQYGVQMDQQRRQAPQQAIQLQQQNRTAQYTFQLQYIAGLQQQQLILQNARNYNYGGDPFFYTPANYRYSRGGRYYETNNYGVTVLRQAVNYGYEQGFQAGLADRQDRWAFNYRDSYAYVDGNYGYGGFYVDRDEYNYYFRQGFRRGYDDGYYSRHQYGAYTTGRYTVSSPVLSLILNFQTIR